MRRQSVSLCFFPGGKAGRRVGVCKESSASRSEAASLCALGKKPSEDALLTPPFSNATTIPLSGRQRAGPEKDGQVRKIRPQGYPYANRAEASMRHFGLMMILSLGISLAVRAEDQGPVQKTGQTVEKAAVKTGQTIEHGAQATGRTVGKGLKKAGNTLEKAGNGTTSSSRHHAKTKRSTAKASPSPSPKPESSPVASPSATPVESTPTPGG
jgi:hypothetical protein